MTWGQIRKSDDIIDDMISFVEERMSGRYSYCERDGRRVFRLDDGSYMKLFSMRGKGFDCIGMEYGEDGALFPDDGDLYYFSDLNSPDDMFDAMLKDTMIT